MSDINERTVDKVLSLAKVLGEFGQIKRAVKMPNGQFESDSHHSFTLALIAFELASEFAPELDLNKILVYSLVHDLSELITGDMATLTASPDDLKAKAERDEAALLKLEKKLSVYPYIWQAVLDFAAKRDQEFLFIYWLDKTMPIATHFYDQGAVLYENGVKEKKDIAAWYERTLKKLRRAGEEPPESVVKVLELSYIRMRDELF